MLTEAEKEWLERRKNLCLRCDLNECPRLVGGGESHMCRWFSPHRIEFENYRDAAEFEARVQKWLMYQYEKVFQCKEVSGGFMPSRETMLMFSRLAVEEEMEFHK